MLLIKKINLINIGCFENVVIDFNSESTIKKWVLVLGNNGVGKTTLLRCIAIGLCDATSAASLIGELYSDLIRKNASGDSKIKVTLYEKDNIHKDYVIETVIKPTNSGYNQVTQETSPVEFPWEKIFLCGYGAARRTFGTKDYSEYGTTDAVYTLFNYDSQLQNPELVLRRLRDVKGIKQELILSWIDNVIMLDKGSTKLGTGGITVSGPWGDDMPLRALGDGYQSVIAWIIDFIGWLFLYDADALKKKPFGIILLDEIEQHLHPIWQRRVIKLINSILPDVQIISTSHAPLCIIGSTDLNDSDIKLVHLLQEGNCVNAIETSKPPRGKNVNQILTSYLFGLNTATDDETKNEIDNYSRLLGKPNKSVNEINDLGRLKISLNNKLSVSETDLERIIFESIKKELQKVPEISNINKELIDFELLRQLKKVLE